jgi:hypothetical protein
MGTSVTLTPQARPGQDGRDRSLAELEHDFRVDPCHFLRRACQIADYDTTSTAPEPADTPRATR